MPGLVLVNPSAGPDDTSAEELEERFAGHEVVECDPGEVAKRARDAVTRGIDFVAVAGGDGTLRCAAEVLAGTDVPLLPIPAGTRNHFAKDLGIPTLDDAVAAVRGAVRRVDVGRVNDHRFVNNSSIGVYPRIVVRREAHEHRLPKGVASVVAAWEQVRHRGQRFTVTVDGRPYEAWLVFVGNGRYGEGLIDLADRESLDSNELDVRVALGDKPMARLRLLLAVLFGGLARSPLLVRMCTPSVDIDVERRGTVEVALDGEVVRMETPLRYCSEAGALSVLVPRKTDDR
ncbi:MAG: sphingosine kinase [Acidimicrobiales bacterium]|nr:sphingosine kinase [Acidimicrobiales bacterium]